MFSPFHPLLSPFLTPFAPTFTSSPWLFHSLLYFLIFFFALSLILLIILFLYFMLIIPFPATYLPNPPLLYFILSESFSSLTFITPRIIFNISLSTILLLCFFFYFLIILFNSLSLPFLSLSFPTFPLLSLYLSNCCPLSHFSSLIFLFFFYFSNLFSPSTFTPLIFFFSPLLAPNIFNSPSHSLSISVS